MTTKNRLLWTTRGSETLQRVRFVVETAVTLDATNYWAFTVYRRHAATGPYAAETVGTSVGTYSLASRSLVAGEAVTLYDDAQGLLLDDGDKLVAVAASSVSPAVGVLDDPKILLTIQRNTR